MNIFVAFVCVCLCVCFAVIKSPCILVAVFDDLTYESIRNKSMQIGPKVAYFHLLMFLSLPDGLLDLQLWAARPCQHQSPSTHPSSWLTTPSSKAPQASSCHQIIFTASTASVPYTPSTSTSGPLATHLWPCPAVPSPNCLPSSLPWPLSPCSLTSCSPNRTQLGCCRAPRTNPALTLPTLLQQPPRRII